jgi:para-nitrobenzyl esterase
MRFVIAAILMGFAVAAAAGVSDPLPMDPVSIDSGRVAGTAIDGQVKAYLGIPFAAPPVRDNRWREPQPVAPWQGIYHADALKPECPQGLRSASINHYFGEEAVSEDCLYLNLWAPTAAKAGDKLPVIVWIYGGAFNVGSASSPIYSGVPLARKGVIYVAANYRLGVLGFLAHPELTRESGHDASGNWGFLDQVASLRWVKRNIAAFGGDPDNVTLVGQSAGSMSINDLQASPLAKGLFRRVFGLSGSSLRGGPGDAQAVVRADAEAAGVKLQQALQASDISAMRMVSFDKLMAAAQQAGVRAGPIVDGWYLPQSPQRIFESGQQSDVPVVTGSMANDIGTSVPIRSVRTVAAYREAASAAFGANAEEFLRLWPAAADADAARQAEQIGRESGFGLGAHSWATLQALHGRQPSYLYMFAKVQPFTPGVTFSDFDPATAGAYHMGDVPYVLGTYEAFNLFRTTRDWTGGDRDLSEALQDLLVAYARTGIPETARVKFVRFDPKHERRLVIGDQFSVEDLNAPGIAFLLQHPAGPLAPAAPARPTY